MKCRSEWKSPATDVRIRTSRGPGFGRLTSSITSGLLTSCRTAAFIGVSPYRCLLYLRRGKCEPSPIQLGFTPRLSHMSQGVKEEVLAPSCFESFDPSGGPVGSHLEDVGG